MALLFPLLSVAQRSFVVAQHHPDASDQNPGTALRPFSSIHAASQLAQPGDTILVHRGVYRERIAPPRGGKEGQAIVYLAAAGEKVVVKASEMWRPSWEPVKGHPGVYAGSFASVDFTLKPAPDAALFPGAATHYNPYLDTLKEAPSHEILSLGQIFVNDEPLTQVGNREDLYRVAGTWMVNETRDGAYVHFPDAGARPEDQLVELTTRRRCFAPYVRGLGHIHLIGFRFLHGATNFPENFWRGSGHPQAGMVSTRGGHHWRIENCSIRLGQSIGLDIGNEGVKDADGLGQERPKGAGYHLILNNIISDNGCGGIEGIGSTETRIVGNLIERNNRLGFTAPEIGGIKLHVFERGLIEDNLIRDNYGYGLWLDNVWTDSRVTRNVIIGNHGTGMFIELGLGPLLVDNNIIALNHNLMGLNGDGVYSHDASGVTFAHNLVYGNANVGLWVHLATDRSQYVASDGIETETKTLCEASHWRIFNNMFLANHGGTLALPAITDRSRDNQSDFNLLAGPFDALSSETFADGLDQPSFRILTNKGRVNADSLYTAFAHQLGLPEAASRRSLPDFTLEEWRQLTELDLHSQHPLILRPILHEAHLRLTFLIDSCATTMSAPEIAEINHDFWGNERVGKPVIGPFQALNYLPSVTPQPVPHRGPYNHIRVDKYPSNSFYLGQWPKLTFPHADVD